MKPGRFLYPDEDDDSPLASGGRQGRPTEVYGNTQNTEAISSLPPSEEEARTSEGPRDAGRGLGGVGARGSAPTTHHHTQPVRWSDPAGAGKEPRVTPRGP